MAWIVWPFRSTSSVTVLPGTNWLVSRSSGCVASSVVPSTAVMMSPGWSPALAAGLSGTTASCDPLAPPVWSWPANASADGIQAPLSTGSALARLIVGSIVS
jgi:hypothetical protein